MTLTVGSLFSGIGGLELGLERAGMQVKWQVEIDGYARRVLEKHWPDVLRLEDVRTAGAATLPPVDLICGGFPCQDISNAGKRAGIEGERSGLWSEFHRIIRELRPRYVLVENVAALRSRGLDRVLGDLASSGFDAEWDCIPASALGAPHQRDRLFIVAYAAKLAQREPADEANPVAVGREARNESLDRGSHVADTNGQPLRLESGRRDGPCRSGETLAGLAGETLAHPGSPGLEGRERDGAPRGGLWTEAPRPVAELCPPHLRAFPPGPGQLDLWAEVLAADPSLEPSVRRVAARVPGRVDRLRCLGNAVVPQVGEYIGRLIMEFDRGQQ